MIKKKPKVSPLSSMRQFDSAPDIPLGDSAMVQDLMEDQRGGYGQNRFAKQRGSWGSFHTTGSKRDY